MGSYRAPKSSKYLSKVCECKFSGPKITGCAKFRKKSISNNSFTHYVVLFGCSTGVKLYIYTTKTLCHISFVQPRVDDGDDVVAFAYSSRLEGGLTVYLPRSSEVTEILGTKTERRRRERASFTLELTSICILTYPRRGRLLVL